MGENIDPTWLAFHLDRSVPEGVIESALRRVHDHYAGLVDYPQTIHSKTGRRVGVAVIGDAEPRCRWPHFAGDDELSIATAYAPTGWERIIAATSLRDAPVALGRAVAEAPEVASAKLNAPAAVAVLTRDPERLVIVNDAIGAARLYELRIPGARIWSNRPGALTIFAGVAPVANHDGWLVLAASSWFLADASPIRDVRRIGPSTVIEADPDAVRERTTTALDRLVVPTDGERHELAAEAGEQAFAQALAASSLWPGRADVDLSGGRDSRLAAAAVVAAGIEARFLTSDATPGEADVARALAQAAPGEIDHRVRKRNPGSATPGTPLLERARNLHLLHDGVRHPQKLRGKMTLPRPRPASASFSGHGGEIAHGFFYKNDRQLRKLKRRRKRLPERLMRFFTKDHDAARPEAYERAREVIDATLSAGRERGLNGPVLLDWFYLVDRFVHRSGVSTDSERISVFATPAFIRAAFSLAPEDRLTNSLHIEIIRALVPAWADVPFFDAPRSRMPKIRRQRLWEVPADTAVVEEVLATGGSWAQIYDADRARAAWREVRGGGGSAKWEGIFEGIVFRHSYDDHLRILAAAAAGEGVTLVAALEGR